MIDARRLAEIAFVLLLIVFVAGQLVGQPILLGYVETGSMEPTLDPGDGFVAVPTQVAGPVEEGDVVVFEAEEIQGGGLTTHRVVGETERGYVTRGDANPFTDQDNDEPPVQRSQIAAKALQVNGQVVVIPRLGTAVGGIQTVLDTAQRALASLLGTSSLLGTQGLAYLFFAASLVWYALAEWRAEKPKERERDRSRDTGVDGRLVAGGIAALLVIAATAAMVAPAGAQEYGVVSAEFESDRPDVVRAGESKEHNHTVGNGGFVPVVAYLEPASEGVDAQPRELRVEGRSTVNATVTLHAPPETGYYREYVVERRYLALLPTAAIRGLYGVHPWLPVLAIDALLGIPTYLSVRAATGRGRVRDRSRARIGSIRASLRRRFTGSKR